MVQVSGRFFLTVSLTFASLLDQPRQQDLLATEPNKRFQVLDGWLELGGGKVHVVEGCFEMDE